MPGFPYIVSITVNQSGGSARANASLKLTNETTGEEQTFTANANGQALYDLYNLTQGYTVGDKIKVEQVIDEDEIEIYASANGDETNPTLIQCANNTRTQIKLNTARVLLNTSRNPATYDLKITLND